MKNEKNKISPETQGEQGIFQAEICKTLKEWFICFHRHEYSTLSRTTLYTGFAVFHLQSPKKQTNTLISRKMVMQKQSLTLTFVEMFNWASFVQIVYSYIKRESFTGRIFAL